MGSVFAREQRRQVAVDGGSPASQTDEERKRLATFESAEYHKRYLTMYLTYLAQRSGNERLIKERQRQLIEHYALGSLTPVAAEERESRRVPNEGGTPSGNPGIAHQRFINFVSWILHVIVAVLVAFVAFFLLKAVKTIDEWKVDTLAEIMTHQGMFVGLFFWVFVSGALVFLSTFIIVKFAPAASGSGIPDVMGYLNGVQIPNVLSLRTFVGKITSCILAVSGGLPVGVEAPLIQLGSIVGAGVSQGRSSVFGCQMKLLAPFRNHRHKRDFVTAGAACGVAAAFSAPIGGLLFVMEEVASFWDHNQSPKIFLACMISFAFLTFINPWYGDRNGDAFVDHNSAVIFEINFSIPLNLAAIIPSLFLGAICGLLAVAFTKGNIRVVNWRRQYIRPFPIKRMAEPVLVVVVYVFLSYLFSIAGSCHRIQAPRPGNTSLGIEYWGTEKSTEVLTLTCTPTTVAVDESNATFSSLATLFLSQGKSNIRHMFTRRTVNEYPAGDVLLYFLMYGGFAMYTSGSAVASGLVIPMIVIGSLIGRLFGLFLVTVFASNLPAGVQDAYLGGYFESQSWMDPGVFALIGAAAFFAGTTRLAISIPVIMVELSGELHYLLPIIVASVMAKAVADSLCVNIYHQQLQLDSVPFMPSEVHGVDLDLYVADEVSVKDVIVLHTEEDPKRLIRILKSTSHHAFPVVEYTHISATNSPVKDRMRDAEDGNGAPQLHLSPDLTERFVGTVSRDDLETLLFAVFGHRTDRPMSLTWSQWNEMKNDAFWRRDSIWSRASALFRQHGASTPEASSPDTPHMPLSLLRDEDYPRRINLVPIINWSPWVIPRYFSLQMTYTLFRTMGLRHLIVVDGDRVAGIITRKELLPQRLLSLGTPQAETRPVPMEAVSSSATGLGSAVARNDQRKALLRTPDQEEPI